MRLRKPLDISQTGIGALHLRSDLHKRIIGQDHAIDQLVNVYQTFLAGMNPIMRPIGSFLLLGPTGTGKTRLVEAAADSLVGDPRAMIKVDCAEFQHSHEIAKLVGSPPGYLGHRETHAMLSQEMLNQYHNENVKLSFVLFDEIEKASDALWNLLLGILDKAALTLGDNRAVDFSRCMIFLTGNLGASEMSSMLNPKLGFAASELEREHQAGHLSGDTKEKISKTGLEAARKRFTPEFMNRLDKVVVFRPLGDTELRQILNLELNLLQQRILSSVATAFFFSLTQPAKNFLLHEGTDLKYGARHLKRAIERELVGPFANLVATNQVCGGDWVSVEYDPSVGSMSFFKEAESISESAMFKLLELTISQPADTLSAVSQPEFLRSAVPFLMLQRQALSASK